MNFKNSISNRKKEKRIKTSVIQLLQLCAVASAAIIGCKGQYAANSAGSADSGQGAGEASVSKGSESAAGTENDTEKELQRIR